MLEKAAAPVPRRPFRTRPPPKPRESYMAVASLDLVGVWVLEEEAALAPVVLLLQPQALCRVAAMLEQPRGS